MPGERLGFSPLQGNELASAPVGLYEVVIPMTPPGPNCAGLCGWPLRVHWGEVRHYYGGPGTGKPIQPPVCWHSLAVAEGVENGMAAPTEKPYSV